MTPAEIISAANNNRIITEPKRNGKYRILEISEELSKQQDGTWQLTAKYEEISTLCKYRRSLIMFNKFSVVE